MGSGRPQRALGSAWPAADSCWARQRTPPPDCVRAAGTVGPPLAGGTWHAAAQADRPVARFPARHLSKPQEGQERRQEEGR
jgi:hypothetical protein